MKRNKEIKRLINESYLILKNNELEPILKNNYLYEKLLQIDNINNSILNRKSKND